MRCSMMEKRIEELELTNDAPTVGWPRAGQPTVGTADSRTAGVGYCLGRFREFTTHTLTNMFSAFKKSIVSSILAVLTQGH
jgi:hypothetical protein